MSEMKHTPGPWTYGDWITGKHGDSGNSVWVEVWNIEADGSKGLPFIACKHHDQVANARLIAAAPELLEALQEAKAALEWCVEQGGGPACEHESGGVVCFCKENKAISSARAAIAKATGGKP